VRSNMQTARPIPKVSSSEYGPIGGHTERRPTVSPISSSLLAPLALARTVDGSRPACVQRSASYTLEQQDVFSVAKLGISLLQIPKVTQVTLEGAHQVIPVPTNSESLFLSLQRLIIALIILSRSDGKGARLRHVVAFPAPCFQAGTPVPAS
jgi:hypothetical protein